MFIFTHSLAHTLTHSMTHHLPQSVTHSHCTLQAVQNFTIFRQMNPWVSWDNLYINVSTLWKKMFVTLLVSFNLFIHSATFSLLFYEFDKNTWRLLMSFSSFVFNPSLKVHVFLHFIYSLSMVTSVIFCTDTSLLVKTCGNSSVTLHDSNAFRRCGILISYSLSSLAILRAIDLPRRK